MDLLIVSASQRRGSETARVAEYIKHQATGFNTVHHLELCQYNLPFWDGDKASLTAMGSEWPMIKQRLGQADAFVLLTPEWNGMATPLLKNFLLMTHREQTGHKPVLLGSVVSGINGAQPLDELKMNAFDSNKMVVIPDQLIIRQVEQMLHAEVEEQQMERYDMSTRTRISTSLEHLTNYARALRAMRNRCVQQSWIGENAMM